MDPSACACDCSPSPQLSRTSPGYAYCTSPPAHPGRYRHRPLARRRSLDPAPDQPASPTAPTITSTPRPRRTAHFRATPVKARTHTRRTYAQRPAARPREDQLRVRTRRTQTVHQNRTPLTRLSPFRPARSPRPARSDRAISPVRVFGPRRPATLRTRRTSERETYDAQSKDSCDHAANRQPCRGGCSTHLRGSIQRQCTETASVRY